ncbi:hypothetical protein X777_10656 [Ooceraea biroi]|uniref:Uncharacterized protein n=1 Tax=Ooceraea biroi TaxID=2015173 RepID=A0A026W363_OOCBI|nr:hypothetical protein X777_10656 [Ooceraea biroi]
MVRSVRLLKFLPRSGVVYRGSPIIIRVYIHARDAGHRALWISLNYDHATLGDNDKGSGREVRPGDQAVITRTAELNTCGVVNSPFSRAAIDRSINLRAPVAIRRPLYDQEWRMVADG